MYLFNKIINTADYYHNIITTALQIMKIKKFLIQT